ncbi:hypothetical protein JN11_04605 [Mucilaginibacter frigoritolerans]|uniref:Uncharacterized protein n=2 Tax=Mucilaginibacter frigoritolerans TaxID=652788 RepID=A0A562TN28_9SPHI|nr:hypothetical protein JN11_04605 [Mucilaginibacter frigoritolerans]
MDGVLKQIKQILITAALMLIINSIMAQVQHTAVSHQKHPSSKQLKDFLNLMAQANITFNYPKGFKEINAPNNEYFSFDYALDLPGRDFEIWFRVKSEKQDWASYQNSLNSTDSQLANPDSSYMATAKAEAIALTGDTSYFIRTIPPNILARYRADAGKSYLLTLLDLPETKHYKYALLITLQKYHTGTIMVVCFTNEKGPEFFKEMNEASNCLKFKP